MSESVPAPAPVSPPAPAKKRTSSLGCLGCFSTIVMTAMTALSLFAIRWMNPNWLDDHAFWKGAKLEPEQALNFRPSSIDLPPVPRGDTRTPEKPVAISHFGTTATYYPAKGATLSLADGTRLQLPPGALRAVFDVKLAPVAMVPGTMAAPFAGGVYDFRAGSLEHVTFAKAATVTAPYDPALVPSGAQPVFAVWEDGKGWVAMKSTFDANAKTVTASMPHASLISVIAIVGRVAAGVVIGGGGIGFTEKGGRVITLVVTAWSNVTTPGASVHRTKHFAIHYYKNGDERVPGDGTYLAAAGRDEEEAPLFVMDLARYLEEALARNRENGFAPPAYANILRWDVFIGNAGDGVYGYTPYGGPVFIHHKLDAMSVRDGITVEEGMRATAAHELVHLAQPRTVGSAWGSRAAKPFMEAVGDYMGDETWAGTSTPIEISGRLNLKGDAASFPMNSWQGSSGPVYYEWGSLFRALDRKRDGLGLQVARSMQANDSDGYSLDGVDQALKGAGMDLSDAIELTARVVYHDDLWGGGFAPKLHQNTEMYDVFGKAAIGIDSKFYVASNSVPRGTTQSVNVAASVQTATGLAPATAAAAYVWVSPLPKHRKAKLALVVEPKDALTRFQIWSDRVPSVTTGKFGLPRLPLAGAPSEPASHFGNDGRISKLFEKVGTEEGPNLITLTGLNGSHKVASKGFAAHRWLLLAPEDIRAKRQHDSGKYEITWERNPLRDSSNTLSDGQRYFKEYRLYRKLSSEPVTNFELVRGALEDEKYEDTPPYEGSWVYSVKVVDALGNTSEYGRWNEDWFSGKWEGELRLIEGSLVNPLNAYFEKEMKLSESKKRASIAQIEDAQDRAEAQKELDEALKLRDEYWPKIKDLLEGFEELLRIGAPISLDVTPDGATKEGEFYRVKMTHFAYAPLEDPSEAPLKGFVFKRGPEDTIELVMDFGTPKDAEDAEAIAYLKTAFPPIQLTLCHADEAAGYFEIRERRYTMRPEIDGKIETATVTWSFEKHSVRDE